MIRITGNVMIPSQNVFVRRFSAYSRSATSRVLLLAMREVPRGLPAADGAHEDFVERRLALVEAAHGDHVEQRAQERLRIGAGREEELRRLARVVDAHDAGQRRQ